MPDERIRKVTKQATGMLYCVSRSGVTGQTGSKMSGIQQHLARVRQFTTLPLGVGFGINSAEDVQSVRDYADIAIVGSAFLNAYNQNGRAGVLEKLNELIV